MPKFQVEKGDDQLRVGGGLSKEQREVLESKSPDAEAILKNIDNFNEEISESYEEDLISQPDEETASLAGSRLATPKEDAIPESTDELDLDEIEAEINRAEQNIDAVQQQREMREGFSERVKQTLYDIDNSPNEKQIRQWKQKYGENGVNVLAFDEGEAYVYTHLRRGQWKKIQDMTRKMEANDMEEVNDRLKQKVVQYCTLWPQPLDVRFFNTSRAGVLDSLFQAIMNESYFLNEQQLMVMTTKL